MNDSFTTAINAQVATNHWMDALAQNKIEALQQQINSLTLANQLSGVVKYPQSTVYTAGVPPFAPGIAPFTPFA